MDWNLSWIILGGFAFFLVVVNLIRLFFGKATGGNYLVFGSMSFGVLSVFEEVKIVSRWISRGEFALLRENILGIQTVLLWAIASLIILNFFATLFLSRPIHKASGKN